MKKWMALLLVMVLLGAACASAEEQMYPDGIYPFPLVKDIVGYLKMCHSILPIKR